MDDRTNDRQNRDGQCRTYPKFTIRRQVEAQADGNLATGAIIFTPTQTAESPKGTYTIVIPPPNVTAALHLGHALNNTLQDILIRIRADAGVCSTLWMPGTDHAGIATQTVVEKRLLAEQGKRRTDFERDEFVGHVQSWKDEYEASHSRPAQEHGLFVRLGADAVYDGRGLRQGGADEFLQPVQGRADLSRQATGQLGPGHADRAGR